MPGFAEESRKSDLRLLRVEFHHLIDPSLLEELQPTISEPRCLVGVEGDVPRRRICVHEQALADVERRDAVAEADLDRLPRPSRKTHSRSASPSAAYTATGKML
jgi:hypothetical protein